MTFTIDPFWCGVAVVLLAELAGIITYAVCLAQEQKRGGK
jgi:hypothetical protein